MGQQATAQNTGPSNNDINSTNSNRSHQDQHDDSYNDITYETEESDDDDINYDTLSEDEDSNNDLNYDDANESNKCVLFKELKMKKVHKAICVSMVLTCESQTIVRDVSFNLYKTVYLLVGKSDKTPPRSLIFMLRLTAVMMV
jgi:hypothetical protein